MAEYLLNQSCPVSGYEGNCFGKIISIRPESGFPGVVITLLT